MGRRTDSTTPVTSTSTTAIRGTTWDRSEPLFEPLQHDLIWIDLQTTVAVADTLPAAAGDAQRRAPPSEVCYTGPERRAKPHSARGEQIMNSRRHRLGGVLATETGSITNPSASKNGLRIVYNVSESSVDGHPDWHNNTARR